MTLAAALVLSPLLTADADAAVITVDCASGPFFTIQDGVNAAIDGDTVVVHACTPNYNENVFINGYDDLHLVAAEAPSDVGSYSTGVGTLPNPPVIVDGTSLGGACLDIAGGNNDVSVTGFRIQNCVVGITILQSTNTVVHGNRVQNSAFVGILDQGTDHTTISGNVVGLNNDGIAVNSGSANARILDNRVAFNTLTGISTSGPRIQITNNDVTNNGTNGIELGFGIENRVERNRSVTNTGDNVFVDGAHTDADVIGNETAAGIADFGTGTDLAENT